MTIILTPNALALNANDLGDLVKEERSQWLTYMRVTGAVELVSLCGDPSGSPGGFSASAQSALASTDSGPCLNNNC